MIAYGLIKNLPARLDVETRSIGNICASSGTYPMSYLKKALLPTTRSVVNFLRNSNSTTITMAFKFSHTAVMKDEDTSFRYYAMQAA
ncbi:MAG: hypothetical protein MUE96_03085 [Bacteroidia bacterium]|jgi:hypothetical protein|nr:hypothetical protein [Bacteroidia bacterium]